MDYGYKFVNKQTSHPLEYVFASYHLITFSFPTSSCC